jgi:hypothetical protein
MCEKYFWFWTDCNVKILFYYITTWTVVRSCIFQNSSHKNISFLTLSGYVSFGFVCRIYRFCKLVRMSHLYVYIEEREAIVLHLLSFICIAKFSLLSRRNVGFSNFVTCYDNMKLHFLAYFNFLHNWDPKKFI